MTREELSKAARRFTCAVDAFDFEWKEVKFKEDKSLFEVRRGPSMMLNADNADEAKEIVERLIKLTEPFIQDELIRLQTLVKKDLD